MEPEFNLYGRLLSLSFVGGHPFAVPSNISIVKGIPMSQQNETPETLEAPEARVLVAHLNMDVDTDQGVKVDIKADREALM